MPSTDVCRRENLKIDHSSKPAQGNRAAAEAPMTRTTTLKRLATSVKFTLTAAVLLPSCLIAAPVHAQVGASDPDASVACGAFQRFGGAWTAIAPTSLSYDNGVMLSVAPGQTFVPNQTVGGIEVTSTLDRQCGNL